MSRPESTHDVRIIDTTLRDGSHAMAHQFTESQVRDTVRALDRAGIEVIEVTHGDGLGGSSFNYGFSRTDEMQLIAAAREEAQQATIAVLLVPGIGTVEDLKRARDAGAGMVRVATHCTEADVSPQHFAAARDLGMETAGFLMMAHRTSPEDLAKQARIMVDAGCQAPYVTDSAGALLMDDARARFEALVAEVGDEAWVGYHGHQNMSFGVANSVIAQEVGVRYIDGSLCALGAGSGNSPTEVLAAVFDRLGVDTGLDVMGLLDAAEDVVAPVPQPVAQDGPQRHRAGLGGRLLFVPAARRGRGRALQGARARDPAPLRRDRPGRRPGGHDHRRRDPAGGRAGV